MHIIDFLRQFRVGGLAIFDFAVAFLGIFLIAPFLSKIFRKLGLEIPRCSWVFFTLPIGIIVHMLIGKITPMTKEFLDPSGHYFLKVIVVVLFILGLISIKRIRK
jgi:hypothetical protein